MPDASAKLPLLTVTLGEPEETLLTHTPAEILPMVTEFGQIVSSPHLLQIKGPGLDLPIFETRFSKADFTSGKVVSIDANPQRTYLGLAEAANVAARWARLFTASGFQKSSLPEPSAHAPGSEISKESIYQASTVHCTCSIILEKAVSENSAKGRLARVTEDLYLVQVSVKIMKP